MDRTSKTTLVSRFDSTRRMWRKNGSKKKDEGNIARDDDESP